MNWLHDNFWNLFGGLGASLVAAIVGWLMVRFNSRSDASKTRVEAPTLSNSVVSSGSGNIQTPIQIHNPRDVHISHVPPASVPAPVQPAKTERPAYNVKFIDAGVFSLDEAVGGGFIERGSKGNAIGIRFANEPTAGGENRTVTIKAVLIFRDENGKEILDISGTWLNSDRFEADGIRHKLIVGIVTNQGCTAIEEKDIRKYNRTFFVRQPRVLSGFTSGTVFIRLTSSFASIVLYEGNFTITTDPLSIVPKSS